MICQKKKKKHAISEWGLLALYGHKEILVNTTLTAKKNQRTEGPESRTDGETLIFWN